MRKRWPIGIGVVLAGYGAAALVFPAAVYVPLGLLNREVFYAGKPASYWSRALKQDGFLGRAAPPGDAGKDLAGGGEAAVPVLCQLAGSPDPELRMQALLALSQIGPAARGAAPVLANTLRTEDNSGRFMAAGEALAKADPAAAAEALSAVMRDPNNLGGRAWALAVLLRQAPELPGTLAALEELRHDPDPRLRVEAIHVLYRMRQPAGPLVAALADEVRGREAPVGVQATEVLAEMGPAAKGAVPALIEVLKRPGLEDDGKRWGPPHRVAILRCLRGIGPDAADAAPLLAPLLTKASPPVRAEAARTLSRIGPGAKSALPELREAARDGDPAVRSAAAETLKQLDPADGR